VPRRTHICRVDRARLRFGWCTGRPACRQTPGRRQRWHTD
jgi:hypothetical protein